MYNNYFSYKNDDRQFNVLQNSQSVGSFSGPPKNQFYASMFPHNNSEPYLHLQQQVGLNGMPTNHQLVSQQISMQQSLPLSPLPQWNSTVTPAINGSSNFDKSFVPLSHKNNQLGIPFLEEGYYAPCTSNIVQSVPQNDELRLDLRNSSEDFWTFCSDFGSSYPYSQHTVLNNLLDPVQKEGHDNRENCERSKDSWRSKSPHHLNSKPSYSSSAVIVLDSNKNGNFKNNDPTLTSKPKNCNQNWRCRALFNGLVHDCDLPPGCERPQSDEGRSFPTSKTDYYELMSDLEKNKGLVNEVIDSNKIKTNGQSGLLPSANNRGYMLSNHSWVSKTLIDDIERSRLKRAASSVPSNFGNASPSRKKFSSNSLRIINGKRIYGGTKECYQFNAETGTCLANTFCPYEHEGSAAHQSLKLCGRQLRGLCRNGEKCSFGNHKLLSDHQQPVCDYYLRMICSENNCSYIHVKHADGLDACVNFNRGVCQLGIMCIQPHRYISNIIKERGVFPLKTSWISGITDCQASTILSDASDDVIAVNEDCSTELCIDENAEDNSTCKWYT